MISALFQSPITANKVFEWNQKLEKNELLVRDIIEIDSTYTDYESEASSTISSKTKLSEKKQTEGKLEKLSKDSKGEKEGIGR